MASYTPSVQEIMVMRERNRQKSAAWYLKNRDRVLARDRLYYQKNKRAIIARIGERRRTNPIARAAADAARKRFVLQHPDRVREIWKISVAKRRALHHAFVDAALAAGCVDCGTKEQAVLDLDHIRGKKVVAVTKMIGRTSLSRLFAEIDKCEPRCANCHRRVTAERRRAG